MFSNRFILLLAGLAATFSGTAQVTISGTLTPDPAWHETLYLFYFPDYANMQNGSDYFIIDSARVGATGRFVFGPKPYAKGIYRVSVPPKNGKGRATFILQGPESNYLNLVVSQSKEEIRFNGDARGLTQSFRFLEPSPGNALIQQGIDALMPMYAIFNAMYDEYHKALLQGDTASAEAAAMKRQPEAWGAFMVGCDSIRARAGRSNAVDGALTILRYTFMDSYQPNLAYWQEQLARFQKLEPDNPYLNQLRNAIEHELGVLSVGSQAPDLVLPTSTGDVLPLSSAKKRLTIIDFWASWCGPCISESKNTIRPLYETWASKGLEVYAVSIDSKHDDWLKAVHKHGYGIWKNVWDSDAEQGVKKAYDFQAIPTIYVVDENMNIVAKNLRGEPLKQFVTDYLSR